MIADELDFIKRFCDGTPMDVAELMLGAKYMLLELHGNQWELTDYSRTRLSKSTLHPCAEEGVMLNAQYCRDFIRPLGTGPDSDSSQCPDDDSYSPPIKHSPFYYDRDRNQLIGGDHSHLATAQAPSTRWPEEPAKGDPRQPATKINPLDIQIGGSHYKEMGHHQPWEVLATWMTPEELRGYMKGTVITYLAREQQKGGDLDIEKACHTIQLWQQVRKDK